MDQIKYLDDIINENEKVYLLVTFWMSNQQNKARLNLRIFIVKRLT